VHVADVGIAQPEQEQRAVQVPFEFLDRGRAEARQLEADLAREHVPHDDDHEGEEEPAGCACDTFEQKIDGAARGKQKGHASPSAARIARAGSRGLNSTSFGRRKRRPARWVEHRAGTPRRRQSPDYLR
jgi:hypothetical protein